MEGGDGGFDFNEMINYDVDHKRDEFEEFQKQERIEEEKRKKEEEYEKIRELEREKERVRKFPILEPSIGDKELSYVVNVIKSGYKMFEIKKLYFFFLIKK